MAAACDENVVRKKPSEHLRFHSHELKHEQTSPIKTRVTGEIPSWLTGSLHRVGPGKFKVGPHSYRHWFDGLAVLHRFCFEKGEVFYQNKFLESETYTNSLKNTHIDKVSFGTTSMTDPCMGLFQRFMSWFYPEVKVTDNCNTSLVEAAGSLRATSDIGCLYEVDRETLNTGQKTEVTKRLTVNNSTAHPHTEPDGTVYNFGTQYLYKSIYHLYKIPPKCGGDGEVDIKPVGTMIASYPNPTYYHSFGMTENYFILVEQPVFINLVRLGMLPLVGYSFEDCLYFDDRKKTVIRVFCRRTGKALRTKYKYTADPFFLFHHVNAFEEAGYIVFDVCGYDDISIIKKLYFANHDTPCEEKNLRTTVRRFVLPTNMEGELNDDLNKLPHSSATSVLKIDGSLHCTPQILCNDHLELPQINYAYNGKKYRYAYGVGGSLFVDRSTLQKIDTEDGSALTWQEEHCFPSEPVFVSCPGGDLEDEGVILSVVVRIDEVEPQSFLLVLDAADLKELGRATIDAQLPATLHGIYTQ